MRVSTIICANNPRPDHLRRVVDALKAQILPREKWELLLVDNASTEPLAGQVDLSWHALARHVRMEELGLTSARLCGIGAATADLLVFIDDDNVLEPSYLEVAIEVADKYPFLGAWGGSIEPEFEVTSPSWIYDYLYLLAVREVDSDRWSNLQDTDITLPFGAGLCVRRPVAESYAASVAASPIRLRMDRVGQSLGCAGDLDLALTSMDLGLGTGLFRALRMKHLLPQSRLEEGYLLRLKTGNCHSDVLLKWARRRDPGIPKLSPARGLLGRWRRWLTMEPRRRRFFEAGLNGQQKALRDIEAGKRSPEGSGPQA